MLPLQPPFDVMLQWYRLLDIDLTTMKAVEKLNLFCFSNLRATKLLLPKLIALARHCHSYDQKLSMWYYGLLKTIMGHYYTEGNCLFFGDAEEILSGEKDYDMDELHSVMTDNLKNM